MRKNGLIPIQTPDGIFHPSGGDETCEVIRPEHETGRVQPTGQIVRRINYRVLIGILIVSVVVPLLFAAAHKYQMQRMAAMFLKRAEKSEADGDLKRAVQDIGRYLRFRPDDLEAGIRMALHLHAIAEGPRQMRRVYYLFGRILRQDPMRHEIRLKRAKLLLYQGSEFYLREAIADLDFLKAQLTEELASLVRDGMTGSKRARENRDKQIEIELLRARGFERLAKIDDAIAAYQAVTNLDPQQIEGRKRLAELLARRPEGKLKAGDVLDGLVRQNPDQPTAYVARAFYRQHNGELSAAIEDGQEARRLAPDDPEVLVLAATLIVVESKSRGGVRSSSFDIREIHTDLEKALKKIRQQISDNQERQSSETDESADHAPAHLRELLVEALANLDLALQQPESAIRRVQEELKDAPENVWLRWVLANIFLGQGRVEESDRLLREIRKLDNALPLGDFLEARIHQVRGEWRRAIERCRGLSSDALLRKIMPGDVELLRAQCEEKLGHTQRQLQSYREAVQENPSSSVALRGLAITYSTLGMIAEARNVLRFLSEVPGVPLALARLEIARNIQRAAPNRKWGEVERLLDVAAAQREDIVNVLITRAQVRVHQGNREAADELLHRALRQQPERLEIWIALALLKSGGGDIAGAMNTLDQAEEHFGKAPDILLARLRMIPLLGKKQASESLGRLAATLTDFDASRQVDLLRGFAVAYERVGQLDQAANYWERVSARQPVNLEVLRHRFDLAIRSEALGGIGGPEGLLTAMKTIEGESGPYFQLATARYQIALAVRGDRSQLEKARRGLQRLAKSKTMLAQVLVAQGRLEELDGHVERAVNCCENAVDHGSTDARVIRHLVQYYNIHGQFRKATGVIERFRKNSRCPLTGEFGHLAALAAASNQNFEQAIDYAMGTMAPNSRDFREHILLGQLHMAAEQFEQAKIYFRTALEYGADQPDAWVAWISFLKKCGQNDDVAATLEKVQQQFPKETNPLALARCCEAAGEIVTAETHYREALRKNRKDPALVQSVAEFFTRANKTDVAAKLLREVLAEDSSASSLQRTFARRVLAGVLGSNRRYPDFQEAMTLLQKNLDANPESLSDLRAQAMLLLSRPSRLDCREALKIFRKLQDHGMIQPADHFAIAKLHLALGEWTEAKSSLKSLRESRPETPSVLALGIRAMIDNGDLALAGEWLKSLVDMQPNRLRTVELQARHKIAVNRVEEGLAILEKATKPGKDDDPPIATKSQIALLLVGITESLDAAGRAVAAQTVSQQAKTYLEETRSDHPEHILLLVRLLSLEFEFDRAFTQLEEAWPTVGAEYVASVSLDVLRRAPNRKKWFPQTHKHLEEAVKKNPDSANLLFLTASLAHLRGDYEVAIQFYRRSLNREPNSALIQNELALVLALRRKDLDEALELINHAIQEAGPLPYLLDTRATVFLAMKQAGPAIQDLKHAIIESPSPTEYFHMAQAWFLLGNRAAAKVSMQSALAANIRPESLHPLERNAFLQLKRQLR